MFFHPKMKRRRIFAHEKPLRKGWMQGKDKRMRKSFADINPFFSEGVWEIS